MTSTQKPAADQTTQIPGAGPERIPALPTAVKDAKATRELMFVLRHFHLGDPSAKEQLETVPDDCLPVLLDPFRDTSRLRYDYPLLLTPPSEGDGSRTAEELVLRLGPWMAEAVHRFAPNPDQARILKDHLPWIEVRLRQGLKEREGPLPAGPMLGATGQELQNHLGLDPADRDRLDADLARLREEAGRLEVMGYCRYPSLHLLIHAIRSRVVPRRNRFQSQIDACINGLKSLLDVEWGKSDESIEPRQARDSVGPEGDRFDPDALSNVMDYARGTRKMPPERRRRIDGALEVLEAWRQDPVLVRFVHLGSVTGDWLEKSADLEDLSDPDPCARATDLFDREAAKLARVFSAARIAQLEIDGIYDPAIHDPWFSSFNWEAFSHDELLLVPSVIAVEDAARIASEDLRSLSRLLSSGRPVQILVRVQPSRNPSAGPDEDPFQDYRTELGYLGISHRQAAVSQSSPARSSHLMECFLSSLDATRTSLHVINTGLREPSRLVGLNAWLVAGAAIESRAHPFFRFQPQPDESRPARMSFSENPHPELDWPAHEIRYLDENGNQVTQELAFTFADYCLLVERMLDHFRVIPPGCDSPALVQMQEYLSMDREEAYRRVPYVLAVDGNAILHRLVASRELALASLDRLNYWRTLQEISGVRNPHVERAVEATRAEERQAAAEARERLLAAHAQEVEAVRREAAGEAMQRLTDVLLGMDLSSPAAGAGALIPSVPAPREEAAPEEPTQAGQPAQQAVAPASAEEDDELSFDEPWIDTPLCTSCNDCMKINPLLFIYNDEKQAYLGELESASATYAQLVEAAEICPAKCIHPGRPWNQGESGLEALMERAAPFNQ